MFGFTPDVRRNVIFFRLDTYNNFNSIFRKHLYLTNHTLFFSLSVAKGFLIFENSTNR